MGSFKDNNNVVNKSFLQFVIIYSLTGPDLASAIINDNDLSKQSI